MKGNSLRINGDLWTIVDVAPAAPLAEMVAGLLEDAGFITLTRGGDGTSDILTHLGAHAIGTTFVLVPERDAARAMELIADTVTDYQGDELDALLEQLAEQDEVSRTDDD